MFDSHSPHMEFFGRRGFLQRAATGLGISVGVFASASSEAQSQQQAAEPGTSRKIKLGIVGQGGRGRWIGRLFQKHGGYQITAVADYFPEVADQGGEEFGVPKKYRFSGLKGYQKVLDAGVEAIVLKSLPYFFPEQVQAAVEAGVHVYVAKPVAVDVPGCRIIQEAGKRASQKGLTFLVDYQMPTDPAVQKVAQLIREGVLGPLGRVSTVGVSGGHSDPPRTESLASRLRGQIWCNDIALGGCFLLSFDIHALDVAVWILGKTPVAATGSCRTIRPQPHGGDSPDVFNVIYEYADGLLHDHWSQHLPNRTPTELSFRAFTYNAHATMDYYTRVAYEIRGQKRVEEPINGSLYEAGAVRNIDTFYRTILQGPYDNPTVERAVAGCLMAILGREACLRGQKLTMDDILRENRQLTLDLTGLVE
jgi:predicted dehydrogenase